MATGSQYLALVVGGARMGEAVGRALAQRGFGLIFGYRRSRKSAERAAAAVLAEGGRARCLPLDLARDSSLHRAIRELRGGSGKLAVLINLASVYELSPADDREGAKAWDRHLQTNAKGAYLLTLAAAPLLRNSGRGRVVHVGDWTAASGRPRYRDYSAYYVSKAAVQAVVESLALELAPEILVNGIAPGPILPPPDLSARERRDVESATPLRRWGGPEEIAKAVGFLVDTDFVTGETLRVDGGRHLQ